MESGSVVDPCHIGTDPDSRICTSAYRMRMRIREAQINTDPTDPEHLYKVIKKSQISRNQRFFLLFLLDDGRVRSQI